MGNWSYLYASDVDRLPGGYSGDKGGQNALVHLCKNTIPILWLALFKKEDLHFSVDAETRETNADSFCFVAPRESCLERICERRPRLMALLPAHHDCLDQWKTELGRLECRILKLEFGEIIEEGPATEVLSWFDIFDSPTEPEWKESLSLVERCGVDNNGEPMVVCDGNSLRFKDESDLIGSTPERWWGKRISVLGWVTLFVFIIAASGLWVLLTVWLT